MIPSNIKTLILDMDGVLWRSDEPIGNLNLIFKRIAHKGLKIAFATNNSSKTPQEYVKKLSAFGVDVTPSQIVTSSIAVANLLKLRFPSGGNVFVIGENGLIEALHDQGFMTYSEAQTANTCAVVMGIDRFITYKKMAEATLLIRQGVPFFATNTDKTFPTPKGEVPGAGSWIAVLTTATDIQPQVAGKPMPSVLQIAAARCGTLPAETLVVGDRISTDIVGGQAAGMPTALVLTGVSTEEEGNNWRPKINIITPSLEALVG